MAAEVERQLLNHYKLTSLYPSEWPDREDESDEESEDETRGAMSPGAPMSPRSSTMRFPALGRHASILSSGSSSQNIGSTVQKDEPDPLGMVNSVVQQLRRQGLPVEDDLKLRNRFMLSSTTFSPTLFLSQVHQTASTESLLQGLDFLSRSIEQKSASLKVLVESNFERFVRAKATIDNVYTEMRAQGSETPAEPTTSQSLRRPHSRHQSKSHFRNTSGAFSAKPPSTEGRKKNALTKESEYGVQGIKAPLIELAVKAEEVWGPALGGKEKEEGLKGTLTFLENNKSLFQIGAVIQDSIRRRDFDTLVEEYQKAKRYADDARNMADRAARQDQALTDHQIHQILVTSRVWSDAEEQITAFKRDSWKHLSDSHANREIAFNDERRELHMELIAVLLQLGVDDNPIMVWLSGRQSDLKNKFTRTFDRARIELEVLRRRLAAANAPSLHLLKLHLQSVSQGGNGSLDTPKVLEFWDRLQSAMGSLLALQGGLLGEIADFWETAQSFMSGKAQQSFPAAVFNSPSARRHLELPAESVQQLHSDAAELVTLVRESIYSFFADPPVEDISALFSPIPPTPVTPTSALTTPKDQRSFSFDVNNLPPPSPSRGEPWEKYAFWAPFANSLSGANCLSKVLILVGTAASELASLSVVRENHRLSESLKALVGAVRERSVQAVCAAWNTDAEKCKVLEDWTRNPVRRDLTNMPARFQAFEEDILGNMQKILYLSDAMIRSDSADVVVPPSAKLLQMVRHQFVTSLYKALSGTVENAEKKTRLDDAENSDPEGLTIPARGIYESDPNASTVNATDRSVRMLLTLSNLNQLRREIIQQLITQFENSFTVKLTEEQKTIRDVLGQIDARLFQSYIKPTVDRLSSTITAGITSSSWIPQTARPTNAKPYVYEVLLTLVLIHTEVSTTASTMTNQILSHLLDQVSLALLSAFKQRPHYTLPALMQATLDVELIAQTLSNYTTERASETQSQIYMVLDERTDQDARMKLQGELPEMRAVLKKLRESTKGQFGCFKKERRGRNSERPSSRV